MAYKKTSTTKTQEQESEEIINENEQLKQELNSMKEQMAKLMEMIQSSNNIAPVNNSVSNTDKYITFINLTNSIFVLRGSNTNYELDGQFSKRRFPEREAQAIVNNMPKAISDGYVYIADADFVKSCGLDFTYENLLTDAQLKDLFNHEAEYVIDIYKSASKGQQKIIVNMIKDKRIKNQKVDANILMEISNLCGENLMEIEFVDKEG